ncbi:glycosyltransferase [Flavobacterium sp. CF136]|uniref:glycosyltransferase n=1 Tax=Flavobacterium sp. (strain CF136) TaxID=1144313 RepID=UPI0002715220|nr:glycosyltransferase [Flavobacterium sp. CF136]EJL66731.1 putative glycosyltransferase [Flavobacterium sp. CF136]
MLYHDLFLVIVLYKKNLSNSETLRTLGEFLNSPINILVFDNSPDRQYFSDYFIFNKFRVKYFHDGSNPGLSAAYNFAIKEAVFENKRWVLLLDQDTVFTKDYFSEILTLDSLKLHADTVAIIPKVFSLYDNIISPAKMYLGGLCRPIIIDSGLSNDPITAINSGTIISVAFIKKIGGFSELFPLDMLDHWYFREIYKLKKKVLVLNSIIFQNLSVAGNYQKEVSVVRYRNMLIAEKLFVKQDGVIAYTIFILRLIRRAFKQIRFKNKKYFFESIKSLFSLN